MSTTCSYKIEAEHQEDSEDKAVVKKGSVLNSVLCRLSQFWPVSFVMRSFRGFWWLLGFSPPEKELTESPSTRQFRAGKKRLHRVTRFVLAFLPRRLQSALGYPVCTSIVCSGSPEVRSSPTKPSGKGSKRKQDDVDEDDDDDEEELPQPSWVEVLTQELVEEDSLADPDYEPGSLGETDSEEYRSHNDTESDIEGLGNDDNGELSEVRSSRTKSSEKGSERKEDVDEGGDDDDDEGDSDEEEPPHPSWAQVLSEELVEEDSVADPDYEPGSVGETDSEEYRSHNDTESDNDEGLGKDDGGERLAAAAEVPAEA